MDLAFTPVPSGIGMAPMDVDREVASTEGLSAAQKAAIIVRMVKSGGGKLDLGSLSGIAQTKLAREYVELGRVEDDILDAVTHELEAQISRGGIDFPSTIASALDDLESQVDSELLQKLRDRYGVMVSQNPWPEVTEKTDEVLGALLINEHPTVIASILSKLPADKASSLIKILPDEASAAATFSISEVEFASTYTVDLIGSAILAGCPKPKVGAFDEEPVDIIAGILNASAASQRDAMLENLTEISAEFGALVREAIFTFADISLRLDVTAVPIIVRAVPNDDLITALAAAQVEMGHVVEFILENMSGRMADQLREEIADAGEIGEEAGEAAMMAVTKTIGLLKEQGELEYIARTPDDEEGEGEA
ncbi:MAG: FliG C-terminal domain-containing protein [Pseudomonadota bacterium]